VFRHICLEGVLLIGYEGTVNNALGAFEWTGRNGRFGNNSCAVGGLCTETL